MAARRVGFIGAGNVFAAHASFLVQQGYQVFVTSMPGHPGMTPAIRAADNTIHVVNTGAEVPVTVSSIEDVLQCQVIFITTADAHHEVANAIKGYSLSGKTVIVLPGSFFSGCARKMLPDDAFPAMVLETATSPYASRVDPGTNRVDVSGTKISVEIASSSEELSEETVAFVNSLFPEQLNWLPNIIEVMFSRSTCLVHPAGLLAKKAEIEAGADLLFYTDCVPAASHRIAMLDGERLQIAARVDIPARSALQIGIDGYGMQADNFSQFAQSLPAYANIKAPRTVHHRYLWEEIPIVQTYRRIAVGFGVPTPEMDALVEEAIEVLDDVDFPNSMLVALGLESASALQIIATINASVTHVSRGVQVPQIPASDDCCNAS